MAYKKYIERNGKLYGPYIYESKRVDGKVVSEYHGVKKSPLSKPTKVSEAKKASKEKRFSRRITILLIPLLILVILALIFIPKISLTGKAIIELEGNYIQGQPLQGKIDLVLKEGELLPLETKLKIINNEKTYEYYLSEITNSQPTIGDYYLIGTDIVGQGLGFGYPGKNTQYPLVYLQLNSEIIEDTNSEIPIEEPTNEEPVEEPTTEEPVEEPTTEEPIEEPTTEETTTEEPVEEPTTEESPTEEYTSPLTGGVISNTLKGISNFFLSLSPTGRIIDSQTQIDLTYNNPYNYDLEKNEKISLISGSVSTELETLPDSSITITEDNNIAIIKTNYKIESTGFGEQFITQESYRIPLDLTELNLELEKGNLEIIIEFNGTTIAIAKTKLKENSSLTINQEALDPKEILLENEEQISPELRISPLTPEEKEIIIQTFGDQTISQKATEFKERIIIKMSLGTYSIEYSYQKNLDESLLNYYLERDKINWLKDIANNLLEEKSVEKPLTNLTKKTEIF